MSPAITIQGLSKEYALTQKSASLKALLSQPNPSTGDKMIALAPLDLSISQGEIVGITGLNGAGKSTLLKILARITPPTTGTAEIRGRMVSMLEVGTGFHPELTGRENVFLNGAILGLSKDEIETQFDSILAFSEIETFIDVPVKKYSSGMYVRLAFAVAAHVHADILLIDEVLAVGDKAFQAKCLMKMNELNSDGVTIVFVSHNTVQLGKFVKRLILLHEGKLSFDGNVSDGLKAYDEILAGRL